MSISKCTNRIEDLSGMMRIPSYYLLRWICIQNYNEKTAFLFLTFIGMSIDCKNYVEVKNINYKECIISDLPSVNFSEAICLQEIQSYLNLKDLRQQNYQQKYEVNVMTTSFNINRIVGLSKFIW